MQKDFITTTQAAKVLSVSAKTVCQLFDNETLHGMKINADRRIHIGSLCDYVRSIAKNEAVREAIMARLDRVLGIVHGKCKTVKT